MKNQNNPAVVFNVIQKVLQSYYFHSKLCINSEFSERSVCIQKIETMGHTIPRKLRIVYFEHVQTHLPKQENFLKFLTMVFLNVKN